MDEGHCGLPNEELGPLAVALLEVPKELVQTALDLELAEDTVIADTVGETACVFLAGLYKAEKGLLVEFSGWSTASSHGPISTPARRSLGSRRSSGCHWRRAKLTPFGWCSHPRCWSSPASRG